MAVQLLRRRFTVEEYHRMGETGILSEQDRVELLEGEIVEMTPIGARHAACVNRLNQLLTSLLGQRVIVSVQNPVRLDPRSEPQPDLTLLRPRPDFYAGGHPRPEDVLLVVEVIDSPGEYDRAVKIPLYARAGVPEVWLVDLRGECVEVYAGASPAGYRDVHRLRRGQVLSVEAFAGVSLAIDPILG